MSLHVLDASVVIAALLGEPGGEQGRMAMRQGLIGAVNYCEVLSRLRRNVTDAALIEEASERLLKHCVPFTARLAAAAAELYPLTRPLGLSPGDRACLALARSLDAVAMTTDRAWEELDIGVRIEIAR